MLIGISLGACASVDGNTAPRPFIELRNSLRISEVGTSGALVLDPFEIQGPAQWDVVIQWQRNSVPISGETAPTYVKTAADDGADMRVLLRAFSPGFIPLTAYSNSLSLASASWGMADYIIFSVPTAPPQPVASTFFVEV